MQYYAMMHKFVVEDKLKLNFNADIFKDLLIKCLN